MSEKAMTDSEKVHFLTEGIYRVGAVLFYFRVYFIFALIAEEKSLNQVSLHYYCGNFREDLG